MDLVSIGSRDVDGFLRFAEIIETNLVDHAIPGVACVVDDDVDLAVAEVCGLLDQRIDVFVVEHVSGDSECLAAALVDGICDVLCFV